MKEQFLDYISKERLCRREDRVLLTVSGGIDSVVMADLFYRAGYQCAIAHCNFQLRGEESEGDEAFVRTLAAGYEMPVYVERFDTARFAEQHGISIQMAARQLRYEWFGSIAQKYDFQSIATAHNLNDNVETLFLNLARGTGIKGLTGIPSRNGRIIRPLLFASRQEIREYADWGHLRYREDSSNASRKYHRNRIRLDVIPALEDVSPQFIRIMNENMSRFRESVRIFQDKVEQIRSELFRPEGELVRINAGVLGKLEPRQTLLHELFSVYNFTQTQCQKIGSMLSAEPGKQFISPTHRLYKDREDLILAENREEHFDRYYIDSPQHTASLPFPVDVEEMDINELGPIPSDPSVACLDLDTLTFPLTVRRWLHGDYFIPLGMTQMKKISDFFIDEKLSVPEKERSWILASGKKIVWIMGHRIDNRFKITEQTRRVLRLTIYSDGAASG
ncbi:MAG: tRNA lysidine(34) synthetase TilS [Bacteroidota bacterium]